MLIKIVNYISHKLYYIFNRNKFAFLAPNAYVQKLLRIDGRENIYIGENVIIKKMTWLAAVPLTNAPVCSLKIEKGSVIGNFNHIYATGCIHIEENVLTADKVYIADNLHQYRDPHIPIMKQPILQLKSITIGCGSWIGENVCVIGANIGKHCTVGANAVVTHDIPDYSVAVGIPAKVIKKYNHQICQWEEV
jgi:acetyltransferase-like isoleucine patch superfamily enzyme